MSRARSCPWVLLLTPPLSPVSRLYFCRWCVTPDLTSDPAAALSPVSRLYFCWWCVTPDLTSDPAAVSRQAAVFLLVVCDL